MLTMKTTTMMLYLAIFFCFNRYKLFTNTLFRDDIYSVLGKKHSSSPEPQTTDCRRMSKKQCALKCLSLEDECCEATYNITSGDCKTGINGCCNYQVDVITESVLISSRIYKESPTKPLVVTNGLENGTWHEPEFCHRGHYAVGYKVTVEQLVKDFTGINAIEIICGSKLGHVCGDTATSRKSYWTDKERNIYCTEKTFLESFNLKVEPYNADNDDNSGPNWIKFRCRDLDTLTGLNEIEASRSGLTYLRGMYGDWSNSCPPRTAICGVQTKILRYRPKSDDMALTDVKFFCCY